MIYNKKTNKILEDDEIIEYVAICEHEIETHKRAVERLLYIMSKGECPYGDETPEEEDKCTGGCEECLREYAYQEDREGE